MYYKRQMSQAAKSTTAIEKRQMVKGKWDSSQFITKFEVNCNKFEIRAERLRDHIQYEVPKSAESENKQKKAEKKQVI